jgi:hypothetical protein
MSIAGVAAELTERISGVRILQQAAMQRMRLSSEYFSVPLLY